MDGDVLILSGLWNSGPEHWQTHWQARHPAWRRVEHRDWIDPVRDEWVAELDAAVATCNGAPVLVAHSLGCMLAAHWAASRTPLRAAGAFLVAPSDVEAPSYPIDANGFSPCPWPACPSPAWSSPAPTTNSSRANAPAPLPRPGAARMSRSEKPAT